MSQAAAKIVHRLKRIVLTDDHVSDSQLIRSFLDNRDEQAFFQLMRRHGPMVLGVCRRWLGATPDADDAFQTTFIALAQQASRIKVNLPGWLHQVAQRTSQKVLRRRSRHISADCDRLGAESLDQVEWRDLRRVLDDELQRLPTHERSVILLCLVEGLTRDEAAQRMNVSLRTVDRYLQRGRLRLQTRLSKRGLALFATAFLPLGGLLASVSYSLSESTFQAAIRTTPASAFVGFSMVSWLGIGGLAMTLATAVGIGVTSSPSEPLSEKLVPSEKQLVMAPVFPRQTEDPWGTKIAPSRQRAIDYLKSIQQEDGTWEDNTPISLAQPGGRQP